MAALESGLVALLLTSSDLTDIIGNRIYPVVVSESATYPCLSYQVVSGGSQWGLDSTAVQMKRVQFDAWSQTYAQCKQIESALAAVLDGFSGDLAGGIRVISSFGDVVVDNWEDASRVYRVTLEYTIQFT
jgi:hypothetical protein